MFSIGLVHEVAADLALSSRSEGQNVCVRQALEQASKRPRAERDEDFLEELRGDLDALKEGDEIHLGRGLSSYRRKMLHEEVERRGWSSRSEGSHIAVQRLAPVESEQPQTQKLGEAEVREWVLRELEHLRPGESHAFPLTLNSFQRRLVHQVAEEKGWVHETVDVEGEKGKGRGKHQGKDGKGKGKGFKFQGTKQRKELQGRAADHGDERSERLPSGGK